MPEKFTKLDPHEKAETSGKFTKLDPHEKAEEPALTGLCFDGKSSATSRWCRKVCEILLKLGLLWGRHSDRKHTLATRRDEDWVSDGRDICNERAECLEYVPPSRLSDTTEGLDVEVGRCTRQARRAGMGKASAAGASALDPVAFWAARSVWTRCNSRTDSP